MGGPFNKTLALLSVFSLFLLFACQGEVHVSNNQEILDTLSAPANLKAIAGNALVDLYWDPVEGAKAYKVYYGKESGKYSSSVALLSDSTDLRLTKLSNDTRYYIAIKAVNSETESEYSDEVSAVPSAEEQPYIEVTPTVFEFSCVRGADPESKHITINNIGRGILRFSLGDHPGYASLTPDSGSLAAGEEVIADLKVRCGSLPVGSYDEDLVIDAPDTIGTPVYVNISVEVYSPPQITEAWPMNNSVRLEWSPVNDAVSYNIYVGASGPESYGFYGNVPGHVNSATVSNLENGVEYYFVVTSLDSRGGESLYSQPVVVIPNLRSAVKNLVASPGNKTIALSWDSAKFVTGYLVLWGRITEDIDPTDNTTFEGGAGLGALDTDYTIEDLENGNEYHIAVYSLAGDGFSLPAKTSATPGKE